MIDHNRALEQEMKTGMLGCVFDKLASREMSCLGTGFMAFQMTPTGVMHWAFVSISGKDKPSQH